MSLACRVKDLLRVAWLSGGLYPELHRPVEMQELLRGPHGGELAAALGPDDLAGGLQQICALPLDAALVVDLAAAASRRGGLANLHLLMAYVDDRQVHRSRWVGALEQVTVPQLFCWGVLDLVSGGHVLDRLRERLPEATYQVLADVGHYPQLEAHERVGPALAAFLSGQEPGHIAAVPSGSR